MKIRLILALFAATTILLGGCASTSTTDAQSSTPAAEMAAFQKSYNRVEEAVERADSVGGEWRDTSKLMKSAKAAAEAGDFTKAQKMLDEAMTEAEMAYDQAMAQKDAGPHY
jgi:outer membrane murein-binding lipoprotein Lpp